MIQFLNKLKYFISHSTFRYYIGHPLVLFNNRIIFIYLRIKKIIHRDPNFNGQVISNLPIDIVLTAVDKDYDVLIYVIDSINKHIKHPIGKIIIISPKSKRIIELCKSKKCTFIDENTVIPIIRQDISYTVEGLDRSGWLFQQLLKYAAEKYCTNEHFLVTDADTIFLRARIFEKNGKILLPCNDQLCHMPYIYSYFAILGKNLIPYVYFTSHHTLINKIRLSQLKSDIEQYCKKPWYRAIVENTNKMEGATISDYETYGQYMYYNHPDEIELEDWANVSLKRSFLSKFSLQKDILAHSFKTASFHSHNE